MRSGHTPGNPRILLPVQNRVTQTNHGPIFVDSIAWRVYNRVVALLVIWQAFVARDTRDERHILP